MFLKKAIARITVGDRFVFQTGDGFLQSVEVSLGEQERASSGNLSIYDPKLKVLNLLLTDFQSVGGILTPKGFLEEEQTTAPTNPAIAPSTATGGLRGDDLARAIIKECAVQGVTMAEQVAYILGTVQRESDMGRVLVEEGSRSYFDYLEGRTDIGNTQPGDGFRYRGRGLIQLTGKVNYERWSKKLGVDMVSNPEIAADIRYAIPILIISMRDGITTGRKLSDYIRPGSIDFVNARHVVNALDKAQLIAGFARTWLGRLSSLGYPAATKANASPTPATGTEIISQLKSPTASTAAKKEIDISKGTIINIELGFNDQELMTIYQFLLTDVKGGNDLPHSTKIGGKQVRFAIAQGKKKYITHQNTSIKQLAQKIGDLIGVKIEVDADDLESTKILPVVRQQETDYQMLLKLAKKGGLFLRGDAKKLKIESLKPTNKKIIIPKSVLLPGSSWGDSAASDRKIKGMEETEKTSTLNKPIASAGTSTLANQSTLTTLFAIPIKGSGTLSQGYSSSHTGIDLVSAEGTLILAAAAGSVERAGVDNFGLGNAITIAHDGQKATVYGHCKKLLVKKGDAVKQGQAIAEMGNTGNSSGVHLHFEIFDANTNDWLDPIVKLPDLKAAGIAIMAGAQGNVSQSTEASKAQIQNNKSALGDLSTFSSTVLPQLAKNVDSVNTTRSQIGVLPLLTPLDAKKGVGKGFEGQLNINTIAIPGVLKAMPGDIVELGDNIDFGDSITRGYRISEVRHSYGSSGITTTLNIYLPVSVEVRQTQQQASPGANTAIANNTPFTGEFAQTPKRGDAIASYKVSSPYGPRVSPGGIGSSNHKGVDVPMPNGTPLYAFGKPGEKIVVTMRNQGNIGGGLYAMFNSQGYTHFLMHCQKVFPGTYTIGSDGMGVKCAESNNTGSSTGPHLHYGQAPLNTFNYIPPFMGFIYAAITGRLPK